MYSHLDSSTTVASIAAMIAAAAAHGNSADVDVTDDPNSWGQLVSQGANGRSSTYERYNWDGSKTVTHVYWTIDAAARCPGCDHRYVR